MTQPPFDPPSASMGVEGSGSVSDLGEMAKRVKNESIDVLIGDSVSELFRSSSYD